MQKDDVMKEWEKRKNQEIFERIKKRHPDRLDKVAKLVAEEVKKGNVDVIYSLKKEKWRGLIKLFYNIPEKGKYGKQILTYNSEVLDLAWKEVLDKASKLCDVELKFLPRGERFRTFIRRKKSKKEILAFKKAIRKSHAVKHAGEKYVEVATLEEVLRKEIPEIREEEKEGRRISARKRLRALISKAVGLKESGMSEYMIQAKRIRGEKIKKRKPRRSR